MPGIPTSAVNELSYARTLLISEDRDSQTQLNLGSSPLVGVIKRIMHFPFAVLLTPAKRNTSIRYVLGVMAVFLLGGPSASPQANSHDGPTVTLGIGIKLPAGGAWPVAVGADHAVFYVPAVGNGEILGVLVVPKGRFVGIRVIPSVQGDTVKIVVSALLAEKRKQLDLYLLMAGQKCKIFF